MQKKAFDQLNIIPPSLSAISNNPDIQSNSFTGIFQQRIANKSYGHNYQTYNNNESSNDYKIKIKKPSINSPNVNLKDIKNQDFEIQLVSEQQNQQGRKISPQIIPLKQNITGYQICKQSFSQQQIIQAFKVIDINKDEIITQEDIMFFLQYIKQPYTKQQVKQMILMVSSDKKKVTFDDFKKIGKGTIIPFADIRIPDDKTIQKNLIYQNIKNNSTLYNQDSSILINASRNDIISMKRFQQSKKTTKINQYQTLKTINQQQQFQILQQKIILYDQQQFQKRKQLFNMIQMLNVTEIVKNYNDIFIQSKHQKNQNIKSQSNNNDLKQKQNTGLVKYLNLKQISKLLQINQKQAKILFPPSQENAINIMSNKNSKNTILAKRVMLQTIAFSPLNKIKKLQLGIVIMLKKKTINFKQLYFLLQILKGKDQSQSMKKKILTILKGKNISKNDQIDKFYALQIIHNSGFNFNF